MKFDLEKFISDCKAATEQDNPREVILGLVKDAIANPQGLAAAVGYHNKSTYDKIFVSDDLVIVNVVWSPGLSIIPHNHNCWAVIGVYVGQEKNIFWQRIKDDDNGKIQEAGNKIINAGESVKLGSNIIHSITNPTNEYTGAIHVYGGDIFKIDRSEWDTTTLHEAPYDACKAMAGFASHQLNSDPLCLANIHTTNGKY
jgi:predicted metal-dependent enzyme (double-stranded beta helix superfamily)